MRLILGFLILSAIGCASSKPCSDGEKATSGGIRFFSSTTVTYYPCKGPCHREDNPVDCVCTRRCPCWNYHQTVEPLGQVAAQKEAARQDSERKEIGEQQFQFDQAKDHHLHGRYAEAMVIFKKLYFYHPEGKVAGPAAYNVACEYALMGDKDLALEWLENAVMHGWTNWDHMRHDKELDSVRDEPRYKKMFEGNQ